MSHRVGSGIRVWESEFNWSLAKRDGSVFFVGLALVLRHGEAHLALANSPGETLQVAMINQQRNRLDSLEDLEPTIVRDLFGVSNKAVGAGARVIAWSEANADIPLDYEIDLSELGMCNVRATHTPVQTATPPCARLGYLRFCKKQRPSILSALKRSLR